MAWCDSAARSHLVCNASCAVLGVAGVDFVVVVVVDVVVVVVVDVVVVVVVVVVVNVADVIDVAVVTGVVFPADNGVGAGTGAVLFGGALLVVSLVCVCAAALV